MIKLMCISSLFEHLFIPGKTYNARELSCPDERFSRYMIESEEDQIDYGYIIWIYGDGRIVIPGCGRIAKFAIVE